MLMIYHDGLTGHLEQILKKENWEMIIQSTVLNHF